MKESIRKTYLIQFLFLSIFFISNCLTVTGHWLLEIKEVKEVKPKDEKKETAPTQYIVKRLVPEEHQILGGVQKTEWYLPDVLVCVSDSESNLNCK
ncbi:hypothetical protein CH373_14115 [Leptospira perolatii]|uniref:Uncharacterized protein n=1 Tax=Leptospira perolatii TaxID=2023191 RepID=A0A2M9ZKF7_9LEPT|nr:hypothetical protein [Leptospira perolatii]PJZ69404.1 hypothetical protein CH360_11680 [Leptospira perolatii]PJZ72539.1 hypothetical protein CH373_14115 [Leptospira perolatii]